ncbi:protein-disulfide reductase DsbD family protein [Porticoccaceae bacterium LTM1]|nr:protein-disulfide reductase DsbD family protein [Porticoccaceae bacterium LTM1]
MKMVLTGALLLTLGLLANSSQAQDYTLGQFDEAVEALDVAEPSKRDPLQMSATLVPNHAAPGETVVAVVKIRLMPGWHFYHHVPATEPYIETKWYLELGDGLMLVDDWSGPEPRPYETNAEMKIHKGSSQPLVFFRELVVAEGANGEVDVDTGLRYQTCDPYICLPPKKKSMNLKLTVDKP